MTKRNQNKCTDVVQILGGANHNTIREANDFYATPTEAVKALMKNFEFDKSKTIYDPCVGKGHILKPFRDEGFNVKGTDLVGRADYFDPNIKYEGGTDYIACTEKFDGTIVTNPPYEICKNFAETCINNITDGNYVCMLLKIQFLETKSRYELFKKYPPKYVYVFVNRIGCIPGGESDKKTSSAICYAWYVWEKGYTGEPIIRWLA